MMTGRSPEAEAFGALVFLAFGLLGVVQQHRDERIASPRVKRDLGGSMPSGAKRAADVTYEHVRKRVVKVTSEVSRTVRCCASAARGLLGASR